ncbi:MAG: phosphatase PAP2 family protein [Acidimicrobiia bacterium]
MTIALRTLPSRMQDHLALSRRGVGALIGAMGAMALSLTALGGVTEDVTRHDGLEATDARHLMWFVDHRTSLVLRLSRAATLVASPPAVVVVAVATAVLLWWKRRRLLIAATPVVALGGAVIVAAAGKVIVGRQRPPIGLRLVAETEPSFPSAHTTDATALFMAVGLILAVVVLRRPIARTLAVVGAASISAAVGVSRLFLGVHWPTDVLAGWTLGFAIALVAVLTTVVADRAGPDASWHRPPAFVEGTHLRSIR